MLRQVNTATPVAPSGMVRGATDKISKRQVLPSNSSLSPTWKKRVNRQLLKWWEMFSKNDYNVGCAKSAPHRIQLQKDKPFQRESSTNHVGWVT